MMTEDKKKIKKIIHAARPDLEWTDDVLKNPFVSPVVIDNLCCYFENADGHNQNIFCHFLCLNKLPTKTNLKKVFDYVLKKGYKKIYVPVRVFDKKEQKLLNLFGFQIEATLKNYFRGDVDCLIFSFQIGKKVNA